MENDLVKTKLLSGEFNSLHIDNINGLGPLEMELVELMWKFGESDIAELHRAIVVRERASGVPLEKEIRYTTVLTTVARLVRKGLLSQDRSNVKFRYRIVKTREQVADEQARRVVDEIAPRLGLESLLKAIGEYSSRRPDLQTG